LAAELELAGLTTIALESSATTREEYLRRPDLGKRLSDDSRTRLAEIVAGNLVCDLCLIVSDGLSAQATRHAPQVLVPLHARLVAAGWSVAPIIVVGLGRVSIQDEIGQCLRASLSLILLGERPGLGTPDSLGAYFIFGPQAGRSDADRNCVSNIRPGGLLPVTAAETLHDLLTASRHRQLSGVELKDERLLTTQPTTLGQA
jgi:ethanolamine ammonia-lyase small subunit